MTRTATVTVNPADTIADLPGALRLAEAALRYDDARLAAVDLQSGRNVYRCEHEEAYDEETGAPATAPPATPGGQS